MEVRFSPNRPKSVTTKLVYPTKPIVNAWQPLSQLVAEETLGLSVEGNTAALTGEFENELISKKEFGGYSHATWSASGAHWVVEGAELVKESRNLEASLGTTKLETTIVGVKITIECDANKFVGSKIEAEGKSKGEMVWEKCTTNAAKCTVNETFKFKVKDQIVKKEAGAPEDEFKPETGEIFTEITLSGKECALTGKYKLEGNTIAALPSGEKQQVLHEISFSKTGGGKLTIGGNTATLTGLITAQL